MERIEGFGGGSSSDSTHTPVEAADSLHSTAFAQIIDILGEGPFRGFVHPDNILKDVILNGTPVANADGTLNFTNVKIDTRSGTQSQTYMQGFPDVENEIAVGLELTDAVAWTQTVTDLQLTALRVRLSVPSIQQSNATTGDISGYSIAYAIDLKTDGGSFINVLNSAITGKASGKYEKSHRIDLVPATTNWVIRVRRLTANKHLATVADTTTIESYTELVDAKFRYPNTAYVGIIVDAKQFSSIPTRAYNCYGRIMQVPSNYNYVDRSYTGVWDGTFKPSWTDNPAWIFYDIATNDRFGLGNYINPSLINKWNLYTIAQYCDGLVPDGFGGTEPRFTCTVFFQTQANAIKVLQDLSSVFRGMAYWAAGTIQAVADMPSDPVYTYNNANVIDGKFTYSGSKDTTRFTVALVSWNNPANNGIAEVHYVDDPVGIARYGIRLTQVIAVGATSRGQAQRVGDWILLTSRLETETCMWSVGLDGAMAAPGQIVRVLDAKRAGSRQSGRMKAATVNTITLDGAPLVALGDSLTVTLPSGITETQAVSGISGSIPNQVLSVASNFSELPNAESVWAVETAELNAQTFRLLAIKENKTDTSVTYALSGVAHNASKFDSIDLGKPITVPPVSIIPPSSQASPTVVSLTSVETAGQVLVSTLMNISWSQTTNATSYAASYRKDDGEWVSTGIVKGLSVDIHNVQPGSYDARVSAINAKGVTSVPTYATTLVISDQTKLPTSASDIAAEVAAAQAAADAANAALANIASDNLLSQVEKPVVIRDWDVIIAEQAGIDAQAVAFGITTEKTTYDSDVTALTNYLATLTTPVLWSDLSGDTTIVGTDFRSSFANVYTARQALLNAIYAAAKAKADAAQAAADNAQSTASAAQPAFILNPNFADGLTNWVPDAANQGWYETTGPDSPNPLISTYAVHAGGAAPQNPTGTATTALRNVGFVPISPGESFTVSVQIHNVGSPNGTANCRISWRNSAQGEISVAPGNMITRTGTSMVSASAPIGAVYAHAEIAVYGHDSNDYFTFTGIKGGFQEIVETIDEPNTTRTALVDDTGTIVRGTNAAGLTITIDTIANSGWLNGATLYALQGAAGAVKFVGATGVTFAPADSQQTRALGSLIAVKMISDNVWEAVGDLAYTYPACTVQANPTNTTAQPVTLAASADAQFLQRKAGALVFDALPGPDLARNWMLT